MTETTTSTPYDPWRPVGTPPPTQPPLPPEPPTAGRRRGVLALVAVALAAGLVGGGVGAAVTATTDDPTAQPAASALDAPRTTSTSNVAAGDVEKVAAAVLPSVVSIEARTGTGGGEGTGVVLDTDGTILTNNHVVAATAEGGQLTVTLQNGDTADAEIVGRDPATDLAVIRAKGLTDLTPAKLGDSSSLSPGEEVVAIGSPLGLQGTVTSGIVSALDRPVRTGGADATGEDRSTVINAVQTDAAINPGNSGGPLVNMAGEVVGINSAIASLGSAAGGQSGSIGLGFAIPVDQARVVAEQLVESGSAVHAQLGVSVQDASSAAGADSEGAGVALVQEGGAAADAGLRQGDVVTSVGDRAVASADALIAAVRSHQPGDKVELTYRRGGTEHTVRVTLGSDAEGT